MPVYNTEKLIDQLSEQTETLLQKAVTEWQTLPHRVFSHKESAAAWSANECLAHLNSYGNYYLPQIKTAITAAVKLKHSPSGSFTAGWLGHFFTNMMLTNADGMPAKKMSAPKNHTPKVQEDSHKVIAAFIEQQEQLLSLLEEARSIDIHTTRVSISIAKFIKLKLGDTFLFLIAHNYRHVLQAGRALSKAGAKTRKLPVFAVADMSAVKRNAGQLKNGAVTC